jgi:hypothetical protein
MPLSAIEQLLSDIADYGEQLLRNREEARAEMAHLLQAGQRPFVNRVCPRPPGTVLTVAFVAGPPLTA